MSSSQNGYRIRSRDLKYHNKSDNLYLAEVSKLSPSVGPSLPVFVNEVLLEHSHCLLVCTLSMTACVLQQQRSAVPVKIIWTANEIIYRNFADP